VVVRHQCGPTTSTAQPVESCLRHQLASARVIVIGDDHLAVALLGEPGQLWPGGHTTLGMAGRDVAVVDTGARRWQPWQIERRVVTGRPEFRYVGRDLDAELH